MQRNEFSIEDISRGRTMTYSDLSELGGHMFECNKVCRVHVSLPAAPSVRALYVSHRMCSSVLSPTWRDPSPSSLSRRQAHADAFVRAFSTRKYPRQIIVKDEYIVSVKVDDRGFIVHKWTKRSWISSRCTR